MFKIRIIPSFFRNSSVRKNWSQKVVIIQWIYIRKLSTFIGNWSQRYMIFLCLFLFLILFLGLRFLGFGFKLWLHQSEMKRFFFDFVQFAFHFTTDFEESLFISFLIFFFFPFIIERSVGYNFDRPVMKRKMNLLFRFLFFLIFSKVHCCLL